ncbi:hypothetical protein RQP46_007306 [Phenoliferia psychrophenolica]
MSSSETALQEEIRRLSESINQHKASQGGIRGGFRGRQQTTPALPSSALPVPVPVAALPTAPTAKAKVPIPVGGFRNKSLVLNKPSPTPSAPTSGTSTPLLATSVPLPPSLSTSKRALPPPTAGTEYTVDGVVFISDARGTKLVRKLGGGTPTLPLTTSTSSSTPRRTSVSGTQYIRTKSGNLVSLEFARKRKDALERKAIEDKKDRLDRLVGIVKGVQGAREENQGGKSARGGSVRGRGRGRGGLARPARVRSTKLCRFFQKTGQCTKGLTCPYTHDSTRVAICPLSLRSLCPHSPTTCPLSHTSNAHRSPHCAHFPSCKNGLNCPYAHIHVSRDAPVCAARRNTGEEGEEKDESGERVAGGEAAGGGGGKRKRREEERDGEESAESDEELKGISAGAVRRHFKKGKRTTPGTDHDLSTNEDFVELFVPFDDSEGEEEGDDQDDDDESIDSADFEEDDNVSPEQQHEEEQEEEEQAGDVSYRREERDDEDDEDEALSVERLLTR